MIWGLRWGLPQAEFLTPQELRSQRGFRWFGLGPLQSGDTTLFLRCSPWWQEVDRCIGGEVSLSGDDDSAVLPHTFGCGSLVWARPRDDGYAFPGRREFLAQSFEAGRVVSRWESCWFSVPSSGDILLGSAWGAYKTVEVTFHCTKQILWLLPPPPPSMVEPLWATRASPLWSGRWTGNYVQQPPPLCGVSRVFPHGPVSIRQA